MVMAGGRRDDATAVLELLDVSVAPRTELVLGRLVGFSVDDEALVALNGRESEAPMRARRLTTLTRQDEGRQVALMFEGGDPDKPFILGCVERPPSGRARASTEPLEIDAQALVLSAKRELVLRCGEASIVLKRDGRVVVRGTYVETRSNGVNRIKGGSVQIN
jgi:hypothetical protein